nr:hypothetical protein [Tanacetum cinerariifolium]
MLAHFRRVSKPWCAYINDDDFGTLHGERVVEELTHIRGSCNGLLCLPQKSIPFTTSLAVIHPLMKEFHALPPMQRRLDGPCYMSEVSWGLGFDVSTIIFKMVCVLSRIDCSKFPLISMNLCTMVHALGKDDSWREIPKSLLIPLLVMEYSLLDVCIG